MSISEVHSEAEFFTAIADSGITVVDFYATWCGPCQQVAPMFAALATTYTNKATFLKVDVDKVQSVAQTYDITSIPTFAVFQKNNSKQPFKVIKGANIEALRTAIEEALAATTSSGATVALVDDVEATVPFKLMELCNKMKAQQEEKGGGKGGKTSDVPQPEFTNVHEAVLAKADAISSNSKQCSIGFVLINLLGLSEAVECYLRCLKERDEAECRAAVLGVVGIIADSLTWKSWDDVQPATTAQSSFAGASGDTVTWFTTRLHELLRIETAREIVCTCNRFIPTAILNAASGQQFAHYSLLGSVCSIGVFLPRRSHHESIGTMIRWFQSSAGKLTSTADAEQHRDRIAHCVTHMTSIAKALVYECLRYGTGSSRRQVLRWAGEFLRLNNGYGKEMAQEEQLCARTAMAIVSSVLVQLAEPVVQDSAKLLTIPADYVAPGSGGVVTWDREEERVMQLDVLEALGASVDADDGDEARQDNSYTSSGTPRSSEKTKSFASAGGGGGQGEDAEEDKYAPRVHLFYLAFRSLTLAQSSVLRKLHMWNRNVRHPDVDEPNRQYFVAQIEFHRALVSRKETALRNLAFCESVARWLVSVAKPDERTGALSDAPALAWGYIPQHFIDDTMLATELVTQERVQAEPAQLYGFVSLMLLLMGNTTYCPKPHTHAIFPEFLTCILTFPPYKDMAVAHPWFYSNIIMACVRCYVVLEKCPYEKLVQRYYVARCLKEFLESEYYCRPAKPILLNPNNTELERFTHMLTAEANEALETALGNLEKMKRIEDNPAAAAAAAQQRRRQAVDRNAPNSSPETTNTNAATQNSNEDSNSTTEEPQENYHDLGNGLSQSLQLFEATIDVLVALAERFPEGVLRHMVAQQISAMIIKSLAKLAGPKSKELKIRDMHKYNFKPRELLASVVTCLVKFRTNERFIRHALECGVAQSDVYYALDLILGQQLVPFTLLEGVKDVRRRLGKIEALLQHEQAVWDDAPDFALCALLQEPLAAPVAVPGTGEEEPMVVNREALRHALLQEERNPMTRQPLTFKEVLEFNAKENIASFLVKLKDRIEDWKESRLKEMKKGDDADVEEGGEK